MRIEIKKSRAVKFSPESIQEEILLEDLIEVLKYDKGDKLAGLIKEILNR
jgi:hypothetical protein